MKKSDLIAAREALCHYEGGGIRWQSFTEFVLWHWTRLGILPKSFDKTIKTDKTDGFMDLYRTISQSVDEGNAPVELLLEIIQALGRLKNDMFFLVTVADEKYSRIKGVAIAEALLDCGACVPILADLYSTRKTDLYQLILDYTAFAIGVVGFQSGEVADEEETEKWRKLLSKLPILDLIRDGGWSFEAIYEEFRTFHIDTCLVRGRYRQLYHTADNADELSLWVKPAMPLLQALNNTLQGLLMARATTFTHWSILAKRVGEPPTRHYVLAMMFVNAKSAAEWTDCYERASVFEQVIMKETALSKWKEACKTLQVEELIGLNDVGQGVIDKEWLEKLIFDKCVD